MALPSRGSAPELINNEADESMTLEDPSLFINRELSWIRFNGRVLEEAQDHEHPLLERVKFLAICGSNLDEFFMTRASLLEDQIDRNVFEPTPDGMTPLEQIEVTRREILPLLEGHRCCLGSLMSALWHEKIHIHMFADLNAQQKSDLREYFIKTLLPTIKKPTPEFISPFITNLQVNLLVLAKDSYNEQTCFMVGLPVEMYGRLIQVPGPDAFSEKTDLVFLEDLVRSNLDLLFPAYEILGCYAFRVTRNAEIDVKTGSSPPSSAVNPPASADADFLRIIENSLEQRRLGRPVRLEFEVSMPFDLRDYLSHKLRVPQYAQYEFDGPLGLADLWQLLKLKRPELKDPPFDAYMIPELAPGKHIFESISRKDYVLYHPYDSFDMIVSLFREAAMDPDVTDIYITLYRIDPLSPIIGSLLAAVFNGKSVTALIELKAKFDEVHNINWAKVLRQAGVKVVYNFPKIKVHAKLGLVVRKEGDELVKYSHLGSGNYNAVTTHIYGDIGYLTANQQIGTELFDLFHSLTGEPQKVPYRHLLVSPQSLKNEILSRIDREITKHRLEGGGYLAFKLNALVDKKIIQSLYRASQAGVKIDLNVRGLCCLRPGITGVSENINVISIVGRFLEHARIYYFRNGGDEEVLLGSSDMMPRNLERRVEVLFSVPDPSIKRSIFDNILNIHLKDSVKARRLLPDGTYEKVIPNAGEELINSQMWLIKNRGIWHGNASCNSA